MIGVVILLGFCFAVIGYELVRAEVVRRRERAEEEARR